MISSGEQARTHAVTLPRTHQFSDIVFQGFRLNPPSNGRGIPVHQVRRLARLDGNTDSNHNDVIDTHDRNRFIEAHELFEEVFAHRQQYGAIIDQLHAAGLEYPLQITPEEQAYVDGLFARHSPGDSSLARAVLLFRAVLPVGAFFGVGEDNYWGLAREEGGLDVRPNGNVTAPLRQRFGSLSPTEIIAAPPDERIALCLEYSLLLLVFLRIAGIQASIVHSTTEQADMFHESIVATLGGEHYTLDAMGSMPLFERTQEQHHLVSDREALALHYSNSGMIFLHTGRLNDALLLFEQSLELDPNNSRTWSNMGLVLNRLQRYAEASQCLDQAIAIEPNNVIAWELRGINFAAQGNLEEAVRAFERATTINPSFTSGWQNRCISLSCQGRMDEARACIEEAGQHGVFLSRGVLQSNCDSVSLRRPGGQ